MKGTRLSMYLSVLVCGFFRCLNGFVAINCTCFSVGPGICLCVQNIWHTQAHVYV